MNWYYFKFASKQFVVLEELNRNNCIVISDKLSSPDIHEIYKLQNNIRVDTKIAFLFPCIAYTFIDNSES